MSRDGAENGENPEKLFLQQLETIERAIRYSCRGGSLRDEDAEDFGSWVKLKLIEKDYAVIRKHDRRSSFAAFISVVVQRMLIDYRIAQWGKWHASAEAKRLGEPALTIEVLLYRDGRTIDEVLPVLIRRWPELTRESVEATARRLPCRAAKMRTVGLDAVSGTPAAFAALDEDPVFESDRRAMARKIATIVRETMKDLDTHDRLIFRLHFEGDMSVAEVSRVLRVEQKPLYRRLQRGLASLRKRLEAAGIHSADVEEILSKRSIYLDFDFGEGEDILPRSSPDEEGT